MDNVKLICLTSLVITVLFLFQYRFEFLATKGFEVAVGDRWTGCVGYGDQQKIDWEC